MLILAILTFFGHKQIKWPVATDDNGYSQYLVAAHFIETPYWKGVYTSRGHSPTMVFFREEAKHADPILIALKKGNSMPVYDPCQPETLMTQHPEYASFKQVSQVARDVATVKAADGDSDSASQWLIQADEFAYRLPTPTLSSLRVKQSMLARLRVTTQKLLPRFGLPQLDEQLKELEKIANQPADVEAAAQSDVDILNRSIPLIVEDPSLLGLSDQTSFYPSFDMMARMPKPTPRVASALKKMMAGAPHSNKQATERGYQYPIYVESKLSARDRAAVDKYIRAFKFDASTSMARIRAYAKTLDAASKAHATKLMEAACDSNANSIAAAYRRPERTWAQPWPVASEVALSKRVAKYLKDAKFRRVDIFALQLAEAFVDISYEDLDLTTLYSRYFLLEREQARLAVVDAKIRVFEVTNHRLPGSLKEIGNPVDPLSDKPYAYHRTSPTTYTLAAIGIPGVGKIDQTTRVPRT